MRAGRRAMELRVVGATPSREIVNRQERRIRDHARLVGKLLTVLQIEIDGCLGNLCSFEDCSALCLAPLTRALARRKPRRFNGSGKVCVGFSSCKSR
jgi:hypothetical protein